MNQGPGSIAGFCLETNDKINGYTHSQNTKFLMLDSTKNILRVVENEETVPVNSTNIRRILQLMSGKISTYAYFYTNSVIVVKFL